MKTIITQVLLVAGLTQVVFKLIWHKQINLISHYFLFKKRKEKSLSDIKNYIYIY